jgi:epoxyqueuosine reductase
MNMEMKEKIRKLALSAGADVCGFANIDRMTDAPEGFAPTDIVSRIAVLCLY